MKLNGNNLKIIAVLLMFIEHSRTIWIHLFKMPSLEYILQYGGRIVFPIFVFLMVEGFFKTSNRKAYIKRIFMNGLFMSLGGLALILLTSFITRIDINQLFSSPVLLFRFLAPTGHNIFWSLGLGLLIINFIDNLKHYSSIKRVLSLCLLGLLVICSLMTEASILVTPIFLICYFFYKSRTKMIVFYLIFSILFLIQGLLNLKYFWTFEFQWMMIFAIPFFALYNGERGNQNLKNFFYIFYPIHLWIIFIIEVILGLRIAL